MSNKVIPMPLAKGEERNETPKENQIIPLEIITSNNNATAAAAAAAAVEEGFATRRAVDAFAATTGVLSPAAAGTTSQSWWSAANRQHAQSRQCQQQPNCCALGTWSRAERRWWISISHNGW